MSIKPLHDRILVKRITDSGKSPGGIIIPDTVQEKPMEGKVIAVGGGARSDDSKLQPLDVKKGDRILFGKWSGNEVTVDGDEYLIMKESNVMGILS